MLSADEQQAWEDIRRYYDTEADEPVPVGPHRTPRRMQPAPGLDELPSAAVVGVWIVIFLVIFGAAAAGLAVGVATALGWALWRWWPRPRSGTASSTSPEGGAGRVGEPSITSWRRRLRRVPGEE